MKKSKKIQMTRENLLVDIENRLRNNVNLKMVISSPVGGGAEFHKIIIEQRKNKRGLFYQFTLFFGTKVKHENYEPDGACVRLRELFAKYRQCDCISGVASFKAFMNKDGSCVVMNSEFEKMPEPSEHNDTKNYILAEGGDAAKAAWLYRLGVTNRDGRVLADKQRKFRQVNKFLEIVATVEQYVREDAVILDAGCGKAYLTFALYDYLTRVRGKRVSIQGIDLKADVMESCGRLAAELGYEGLTFRAGRLEDMEAARLDMVVCLHACDTATDYALAAAVAKGAGVILSAPCCQHELNGQMHGDPIRGIYRPLLKHGILKEKFSALLTDSIRALLLEACGYTCRVMEFADAEDTAKNIMIKAVLCEAGQFERIREERLTQFREICGEFGVEPMLYKLLMKEGRL